MSRLTEIFDGAIAVISSNRKLAVYFGACALFFIASAAFLANNEASLAKKKAALASFESMRDEYAKALSEAGPLKEKLEAKGPSSSAMDAVQAAASSAGISKKIGSLKPFEPVAIKGYRQSGVELKLEGVDIGHAVYFLYRLENAPGAIVIDEFQMKSSFENPDALEVRATVRSVARE